jgi:hypothetical protein
MTLAAAASIVFSLLAVDCWTGKRLQPWSAHPDAGLRLEERELPIAPMRHLEAIRFRGNRFVDINIGGYDAFVRGPGARTFTDTRLEVLGALGLKSYLTMLVNGQFFDSSCEQFGLEAAIIDRRQRHLADLLAHLNVSPAWVPVFSDSAWTVFLKRTPANQYLLENR